MVIAVVYSSCELTVFLLSRVEPKGQHSGRRRPDPHRWRPLEREVIDMSKVCTFSTERSCTPWVASVMKVVLF